MGTLLWISGWAQPREGLADFAAPFAGWRHDFASAHDFALAPAASAEARCATEIRQRLASAPRPRVVVGWSLGGLLALSAAAHEPEAVDALLLLGVSARFCRTGDHPGGATATEVRAMQVALRMNRTATLAAFHRHAAQPQRPSTEAIAQLCAAADGISDAALTTGLDFLRGADLRARLPTVRHPTLWLHGAADVVIPVEAAHACAARMPRARVVSLPGVGHMDLRRPADGAVEAVRTWLGEWTAA